MKNFPPFSSSKALTTTERGEMRDGNFSDPSSSSGYKRAEMRKRDGWRQLKVMWKGESEERIFITSFRHETSSALWAFFIISLSLLYDSYKKNCRETDARHGTGRVAGLEEILRVFHRQVDEVALGDDWAMWNIINYEFHSNKQLHSSSLAETRRLGARWKIDAL